MKLTHTPVFVASQRQESLVKFVSQLMSGQVLDLRSQTWSEHNLYKMQFLVKTKSNKFTLKREINDHCFL